MCGCPAETIDFVTDLNPYLAQEPGHLEEDSGESEVLSGHTTASHQRGEQAGLVCVSCFRSTLKLSHKDLSSGPP